MSRVTTLTHGATTVVAYDYNGLGDVAGTSYPEPGIRWLLHEDAVSGDPYPDLDRFNRVVHSRWSAVHTARTDFYHVQLPRTQQPEHSEVCLAVLPPRAGDLQFARMPPEPRNNY